MPSWVWGMAFLVAYVVLTQWLLPNDEQRAVWNDHGHVSAGFAAFVGESQNVLPVHLVIQRVEAKVGRFLRFVVQRRLQLLNTFWGC